MLDEEGTLFFQCANRTALRSFLGHNVPKEQPQKPAAIALVRTGPCILLRCAALSALYSPSQQVGQWDLYGSESRDPDCHYFDLLLTAQDCLAPLVVRLV